ncbi:21 kDa protein-like [Thalictrum thalictroides]|uniref:21 kDa protein-like n=1 Tax=Thalictrum thalictroides TaxID=46969 RepID=A0A7J6XEB6_THATH|nr:21 kDa protein-like [Thalictrum thalictroides]KAF5206710.1 21 kDa protein-like [Thalictrum thalictroides]
MEGCKTCTLLVLIGALVLCTNMQACASAASTSNKFKTNIQFIQTSCNTTTYQKLCVNSLSSYSNEIKTNPQKLAYTALSLTLKSAKNVSSVVKRLAQQSNLKKNEKAALKDCVENMSESVDALKQSVKEFKNLNATDLAYQMNSIMTWVSAALSDDDTCLDGLSEESVNGNLQNIIRQNVQNIAQMTSNALALVNHLNYTQLHFP